MPFRLLLWYTTAALDCYTLEALTSKIKIHTEVEMWLMHSGFSLSSTSTPPVTYDFGQILLARSLFSLQ